MVTSGNDYKHKQHDKHHTGIHEKYNDLRANLNEADDNHQYIAQCSSECPDCRYCVACVGWTLCLFVMI